MTEQHEAALSQQDRLRKHANVLQGKNSWLMRKLELLPKTKPVQSPNEQFFTPSQALPSLHKWRPWYLPWSAIKVENVGRCMS